MYQNAGSADETFKNDEKDLDEIFHKRLVTKSDSGSTLYLMFNRYGKRSMSLLDDVTTPFKSGACVLSVGATAATFDFDVYAFHGPRGPGQRLFLVHECHAHVLGCTGLPEQGKQMDIRAQSRVDSPFGQGAGRGKHIRDANCTRGDVPWDCRCLPNSSISTAGIMWLALRFAFCRPRQKGMYPSSRPQQHGRFCSLCCQWCMILPTRSSS